jgi:hypothetical protein
MGGDDADKGRTAIPKAGGHITKDVPGHQERPLSEQEELDVALDETFPASDPPSITQVDGPIGRPDRS